MGSSSDERLLQELKAGEHKVFFAENSLLSEGWGTHFFSVVAEFGLTPIFYGNASHKIRADDAGKTTRLDSEIRDDIYRAKTVVLYFGPARAGADYDDHWALTELQFLATGRRNIVVYVSNDFPIEILRRYGFQASATIVTSASEFAATLREDLIKLGYRSAQQN